MTTKRTDTVVMTAQQLDAVAGGAPHYTDFGGRFKNLVYETFDQKTNQRRRRVDDDGSPLAGGLRVLEYIVC